MTGKNDADIESRVRDYVSGAAAAARVYAEEHHLGERAATVAATAKGVATDLYMKYRPARGLENAVEEANEPARTHMHGSNPTVRKNTRRALYGIGGAVGAYALLPFHLLLGIPVALGLTLYAGKKGLDALGAIGQNGEQ
jgi:hypothetical protein